MEKEKYSINVLSHIKVDNHVEYLINISETNSGSNTFFPEKYATLRSLYEVMKKEAKGKSFPSFPPNKLFGYEEESFVIQRAKDLNTFFQEIMTNQNLCKLPSFRNFIKTNLQKNSIIKNQENNSKRNSAILNNIKVTTITHNTRFRKRALLFRNAFFKEEKRDNNAINEMIKNKKEIGNFMNKFVKLDYEFDIHYKPKAEEEYQKVFEIINFRDNTKCQVHFNKSDDTFDMIGKNNDDIQKVEDNISFYMKRSAEKFKKMSNLIEPENLLLK